MSDLVERVARAIEAEIDPEGGAAPVCAMAETAIREVLAALREPSGAIVKDGYRVLYEALNDWGRDPRESVVIGWRAMLDAFARERRCCV